jgi:hypothetical protein
MTTTLAKTIGWKIEFGRNKARGIIKGALTALNLQALLEPLAKPAFRFYWLVSFLGWVAKNRSEVSGRIDSDRDSFYANFVQQLRLENESVHFMEFGVFRGDSIRWWSNHLKNAESVLWGFDTFTGLPEDWGSAPKGFFSTQGKIPQIADSRVQFHKGMFQKTLPPLLDEIRATAKSKRLFLHLDADLYGSTLFVLMTLAPYLKSGDVLVFDEFCFVTHEYRAFVNFLESWNISLKLERATTGYLQTAFTVVSVKTDME